MSFGEYVKSIRIRQGIGSRELSSLVGKGVSYISQIESGRNKNPDYTSSYVILKTLGLTDEDTEDTLNKYGIVENEITSVTSLPIENISEQTLTKNKFDEMCKRDAERIYELIESLPDKTKEYLDEILKAKRRI